MQYFAQDYTVLSWDAPCHGKSRPYQGFSYQDAAEVLKGILDIEGIKRAVFVGQSGGGFVFQTFLKQYESMAEGFVAIGTCPYGMAYYSKSDLFWLRQTKWMFRLIPNGMLQWAMAKMCAVNKRAAENMQKMLASYQKSELCELLYQGFAGFIPEICDLKITCPVCLILGEKDHTGKVRQYNHMWHKKEGYPLHIIKNAAHNTNDDAPEAVNEIIQNFICTG